MAEGITSSQIFRMVFGGEVKALMDLKRGKGCLLFQKLPGLLPQSFSLNSFIDYFLGDRNILVCDERFDLFVDEGDVVGWKLPGHVDVLSHFCLVKHLEDFDLELCIK